MVSTFTPNIQLEEPARGDDVGTWDTPVNNNMTEIDLTVGGITTISLNNSPVVLAAAQFQSKGIAFNSTLTGSITITFPTSFKKSYEIYNTCTGSSAFIVTLTTTASSGTYVSCPPGEIVDVVNDGINLRFKNIGRIGTYWDYAGSSVPNWVAGCGINNLGPVPPWLNCDGTTFTSSFYPQLALILGGNTLPDSRGRFRATLDQGAGRISSAATGFSGSSVGASGGAQVTTLSSLNMPPIQITDPGHVHNPGNVTTAGSGGTYGAGAANTVNPTVSASAFTGITAGSSSPTAFTNLPPAYIGGITMIRAA